MSSPTPNAMRIAGYEVLTGQDGKPMVLGRGAFGVIYRAIDSRNSEEVALKVVNDALAADARVRLRFKEEIKEHRRLNHPGIVAIREAGEDGTQLYYAMELCRGGDLAGYVRSQGPVPVPLALGIVKQVADALVYASGHHLLHRDIKPGNILLKDAAEPGTVPLVKVTDFGLSKLSEDMEGVHRPQLSVMGGFHGTLQYASPEQVRQDPLDCRSDIFSLGLTFWHLLMGAYPLGQQKDHELIADRIDTRPYNDRFLGAWHPAVAGLLGRMLEKNPVDRFRDFGELTRVLDHCLELVESGELAGHRTEISTGGDYAPQSSRSLAPLAQYFEKLEPRRQSPLGMTYAATLHGDGLGSRESCQVLLLPDQMDSTPLGEIRAFCERLGAAPHAQIARVDWLETLDGSALVVHCPQDVPNVLGFIRKEGKRQMEAVTPLLGQAASALDHAAACGFGLHAHPRDVLTIFGFSGSRLLFTAKLPGEMEVNTAVPGGTMAGTLVGQLGEDGTSSPPQVDFATLTYWVLSARMPASAAYFNENAYKSIEGLSESGNSYVRAALCGKWTGSSIDLLTAICRAENIPLTPATSGTSGDPASPQQTPARQVAPPPSGASPEGSSAASSGSSSPGGRKSSLAERREQMQRELEERKRRLQEEEARLKLFEELQEQAEREAEELAAERLAEEKRKAAEEAHRLRLHAEQLAEEARQRAEAEARQRAEAEARQRAEAEARHRAEMENELRKAAEAKRLADEEIRRLQIQAASRVAAIPPPPAPILTPAPAPAPAQAAPPPPPPISPPPVPKKFAEPVAILHPSPPSSPLPASSQPRPEVAKSSQGQPVPEETKHTPVFFVVAAAAVFLVMAGAAWMISRQETEPDPPIEPILAPVEDHPTPALNPIEAAVVAEPVVPDAPPAIQKLVLGGRLDPGWSPVALRLGTSQDEIKLTAKVTGGNTEIALTTPLDAAADATVRLTPPPGYTGAPCEILLKDCQTSPADATVKLAAAPIAPFTRTTAPLVINNTSASDYARATITWVAALAPEKDSVDRAASPAPITLELNGGAGTSLMLPTGTYTVVLHADNKNIKPFTLHKACEVSTAGKTELRAPDSWSGTWLCAFETTLPNGQVTKCKRLISLEPGLAKGTYKDQWTGGNEVDDEGSIESITVNDSGALSAHLKPKDRDSMDELMVWNHGAHGTAGKFYFNPNPSHPNAGAFKLYKPEGTLLKSP